MATKNEKTLAQAICGLTDLLSLLKPQLLELLNTQIDERFEKDAELKASGKVPDDLAALCGLLGNDNPIRKLAEGILAEEDTIPTVVKSAGMGKDDRYYYTGLEALDMTQEQRNALKVCKFTVTYRGEVILELFWDATLDWVLQPNEDKTAFDYRAKKSFPGKNAKFKGTASQFLKKMADNAREGKPHITDEYYLAVPVIGQIKLASPETESVEKPAV